MVPPQSRLPLRRLSRARRAIGLTTAVTGLTAGLMVAVGPVLPIPLKEGVDWLRGYPDRLQRPGLPGGPGRDKPRSRRALANFAGSFAYRPLTTNRER
jgi:hypothetical protein